MQDLQKVVEERLHKIQDMSASKLEAIRETVDEKLQSTLERRLGESFKLVSDRLEHVQRGLGEMQSLATGVGDLKRVLTNVKTRGTWGEIQLASLLEQMLTIDQYSANVKLGQKGTEIVEFAVRLPGTEEGENIWLPIDSKFPQESYQRLIIALDEGNMEDVVTERRTLELAMRSFAKDIACKYICPPNTTDFAIMFLPTEGLYAEVLRMPGLVEKLQVEHRIALAGPTTLTALLNSLQMGFKTLAIQKRSSEVWKVLGAVKSEFGRFGDMLSGVQKKLTEAANKMDEVTRKTKTIQSKLRNVEEVAPAEVEQLLARGDEETLPSRL
jgi:DNA recombination protein RmuC